MDEHTGHSYTKDRKVLMHRLSRLEGQVRGIGRMVDDEEYCVDILQQIAALRARSMRSASSSLKTMCAAA